MKMRSTAMVFGLAAAAVVAAQGYRAQRVAVTFSGGYETDERDRGRPVTLVAGALGVPPQVFRDAFSRVRPARGGAPTEERVHDNKAVLLDALSKYGITNRRLDEVSDHYRYRRERGEIWPNRPAKAFAIVEGGKIVRFEVTDPGEGYSSAPKVTVPGFAVGAKVELAFDRKFEKNGSIRLIRLP